MIKCHVFHSFSVSVMHLINDNMLGSLHIFCIEKRKKVYGRSITKIVLFVFEKHTHTFKMLTVMGVVFFKGSTLEWFVNCLWSDQRCKNIYICFLFIVVVNILGVFCCFQRMKHVKSQWNHSSSWFPWKWVLDNLLSENC